MLGKSIQDIAFRSRVARALHCDPLQLGPLRLGRFPANLNQIGGEKLPAINKIERRAAPKAAHGALEVRQRAGQLYRGRSPGLRHGAGAARRARRRPRLEPEFVDFRRRFIVCAILTLPLAAIARGPMLGLPIKPWLGLILLPWIEMVLATPVIL